MKHLQSKNLFILIFTLSVPLQSGCAADLEPNDRYETFKDVQNIKKILAQLTEEFKTPEFPLYDGSGWPEPNPYYYKTKQGLFLYITDRPHTLATPWGRVMLNGGGAINNAQSAAFSLAFLQRVDVQVSEVPMKPPYPGDKVKWYTIRETVPNMWQQHKSKNTGVEFHEVYQHISPEEALSKIGTDCLLRGNFLTATYKVLSIDGKKIAEPIEIDDEQTNFDHGETTKQEWQEFERRYQHEDTE